MVINQMAGGHGSSRMFQMESKEQRLQYHHWSLSAGLVVLRCASARIFHPPLILSNEDRCVRVTTNLTVTHGNERAQP